MLSIFSYAFNAIAPILFLVMIGWFLKIKKIFDVEFFKKLNKFAFHYCFAPLMFCNLYELDDITDINVRFVGISLLAIVILTVISLVLVQFLTKDNNRRGVMLQAGYRSNFAIIGLPLAAGMAGQSGTLLTTMLQAPTIIYFNVIAVLALSVYSENGTFDAKKVIHNIVKNPMIQGLVIGLIVLVIRHYMPVNADGTYVFSISGTLPWVYKILEYLARVATPVALIALGGIFEFSAVASVKKELIISIIARLVFAPLVGFGIVFAAVKLGFISLNPGMVAALIALFGSPISVSSNVMAQEMKADHILAGQIVVWTSLFSVVSLFILISLFRFLGML